MKLFCLESTKFCSLPIFSLLFPIAKMGIQFVTN